MKALLKPKATTKTDGIVKADAKAGTVEQQAAFQAGTGAAEERGRSRNKFRSVTIDTTTSGDKAKGASSTRAASKDGGDPLTVLYKLARDSAGTNYEHLAALCGSLNSYIKQVHDIDNFFDTHNGNVKVPPKPSGSSWKLKSTPPLRKDFWALFMFIQDICRARAGDKIDLSIVGKRYKVQHDTSWAGSTATDVHQLFKAGGSKNLGFPKMPGVIVNGGRSVAAFAM